MIARRRLQGVCDTDGGELIQRPDDREEIVGPRLTAYAKKTAPLVAYYRRLGRLEDVDAAQSVEQVAQRVMEIVHKASSLTGNRRNPESRWPFIYAARKNWKKCIAPD